ncbi:MAG: hypothetical protein ABR543_00150 [Gemmatimonadaceae bacterium]
MMQRSKSLALSFLFGALLVGGVLGFTADRVLMRDKLCSQVNDREGMRLRLAETLGLSETQRAAVDSILDKRHTEMSAIMAPVRPQLDAARNRAREEIAQQLSDDQKKKFQRLIEELSDSTRRYKK